MDMASEQHRLTLDEPADDHVIEFLFSQIDVMLSQFWAHPEEIARRDTCPRNMAEVSALWADVEDGYCSATGRAWKAA